MKEIKVIQSRLARKGVSVTSEQIKTYFEENYPNTLEFSKEQISAIVNEFISGKIVPISIDHSLSVSATTNDELSQTQKQTLIEQIASTLEVTLPIDKIKQISQKMDWAISDRSELKDRIQSAIIAWVNYQIGLDLQQTDDMMQEVEKHLVTKLQESNDHFEVKASALSKRIEDARDNFRTTEETILNLFKIPS